MCGIFGMYSNSPLPASRRESLLSVAQSQVVRGHHAFGLSWLCDDGRVDAFKRAGSVSDHIRDVERGIGSTAIIGHTRWVTHGDAGDNRNNHPHGFNFKDCRAYLVHNGIVSNYERIAASRGLRMRSDCDSEVLARHIEDNNGDILSRVRDAVADVDDSAPLVVAVLVREGLVLARRGNPLYWSEDRGGVCWFASTPTALRGKVWEVPDESAYLIPTGDASVRTTPLRKRQVSMRRWIGSDTFA